MSELDLYQSFTRGLYKIAPTAQSGVYEIDPDTLSAGSVLSTLVQNVGNLQNGKNDFSNTAGAGFILGVDNGVAKFYIGDSSNYLNWTGSALVISGALSAGSIDIGGADATSFHVDSDGNMWLGASTFAAAPAKISNAGAGTFSNITITGGAISGAGMVTVGALNVANRGWTQTSVFSVTDADTIAWGSGTFTTADGTAYSITGSNTGNMVAKTYIYLDTAVSTTAYQTTTTATTAVGAGKVLVAIAQNATGEATYQVMQGQGGQNIDAANIVANSITANELSTSITYTGSLIISTNGHVRSGQTAYNTGTGWFIGNDSGTSKLSIGDGGVSQYMTWDGSSLTLNGTSVSDVVEGATADLNYGLFRGSNVDGLTETTANATISRKLLTTDVVYSTAGSWSLKSGTLGKISSSSFSWTSDYQFFVRLKSDSGDTFSGSLGGKAYFWGLVENTSGGVSTTGGTNPRGRDIPASHIGFIVDWDNKIWATSGSGLDTNTNKVSSQDITDLSASVTHTDFNNYKITTHYVAFPAITSTSLTRPTAGSGANYTNVSNAYDADTNTSATSSNNSTTVRMCLSWDGGTTWTKAIDVDTHDTTKRTSTFGGQYETWGRTWTTGNLSNANFKVRVFFGDSVNAYNNTMNDTIDFSSFGWSTGSMVEITGIEVQITQQRVSNKMELYDIQAKIYYSTSANTGYVKFYVNNTLLATHTTSIPRSADNPALRFDSLNGRNTSSGAHIFYNNYRVKVL